MDAGCPHTTTRDGMRGAQGEALSTADSEDVTHTLEWPMKPLTPPSPPPSPPLSLSSPLSLYISPLFSFSFFFFFITQERKHAKQKVAVKAMALCLSLTVGDSGRLRSLSTETLQHMRSFLKEWPQNPH